MNRPAELLEHLLAQTIAVARDACVAILLTVAFDAEEIAARLGWIDDCEIDAKTRAADTATQLVNAGGVGKFSQIDLGKMLAGKVASATPYISELQEGLNGAGSRKDLETMFQLIYLRFTQPRADANAFAVQANQTKTLMINQRVVPEFSFFEALNAARYGNHPRRRYAHHA